MSIVKVGANFQNVTQYIQMLTSSFIDKDFVILWGGTNDTDTIENNQAKLIEEITNIIDNLILSIV